MNVWSGDGKRPEMGRNTWVLLGVLVLAIFWALSESKKPGPVTPRVVSPSSVSAAAIIPSATSVKITPEGWGKDPFDPNRAPVGSRNAGR